MTWKPASDEPKPAAAYAAVEAIDPTADLEGVDIGISLVQAHLRLANYGLTHDERLVAAYRAALDSAPD